MPTLLVARANGHLSPADQLRLTQLLEKSPQAREVQTAFRRAEEAYRLFDQGVGGKGVFLL